MDKRAILIFVIVGTLVISSAGYFGFATTQQPKPTPTPQTVTANRCDVEQTVTAPGNLENVGSANVNIPTTGRLSQIYVRAGDAVQKGQVLAELDAIAKSEAELKLIEAQQELTEKQKHRTALDYPRATDAYLKEYRQKIKLQKQKVELLEEVYKNAIGPEAKAIALTEFTNAKQELATMETNLKWYLGHPGETDFSLADSELALAQAKYDAAKSLLESLSITAPFDGIVLEVQAETGVTINAEKTIFKVGNPKALEVKANVIEEDFPLLQVGQEVEIYFDARPDVTAIGKISRIIPNRIEGDRPLYVVYITLDEVPDGLADGMTADTAITIAKRENVLCLPRAVVRASGGDTSIVKVWDGIKVEERQITLGLRGDTTVEILSGLKEGEQVVVQ